MLKTRWLLFFAFLVAMPVHFSYGAVDPSSRRALEQLIDAQIALGNARIKILERAKQQMIKRSIEELEEWMGRPSPQDNVILSKVMSGLIPSRLLYDSYVNEMNSGKVSDKTANILGPQGFALKHLLDKVNVDTEAHQAKLATLVKFKSTLKTAGADATSLAMGAISEACEYEGCLALLGKMNAGLAKAIVDINTRVIIHSLENIELRASSGEPSIHLETAEDALSGTVDLQLRTLACQRALGRWQGAVDADPEKLGACFATIAHQSAQHFGQSVGTNVRREHFRKPVNYNIEISDEILGRLEAFVMKSPDYYQLKPWDLYGACVKEAKGHIVDAAEICYGVLRKNRGRPDFTRKLIDIRGDRAEGGDNSGDWYHFFGMARVGMAYGRFGKVLYKNFYAESGSTGVEKSFLMGGSSAGKTVGTKPIDVLEERNDLLGIDVGIATMVAVKHFS